VLTRVKRLLREHRFSAATYGKLAEAFVSSRVRLHQLLIGRYHTARYFDELFRRTANPWRYGLDGVSQRRRELLLNVMPRQRYARLLEVGCAEGWITLPLTRRAEEVTAVDISAVALARARSVCTGTTNVRFVQRDIVVEELGGEFDAIVCAGVLVYVSATAQTSVRDRLVACLKPGGDLILEHTTDAYPGEMAGRQVHASYKAHAALVVVSETEVSNFTVTVLRKKDT
jgi:2-polyprenyl-3-methyl-5-hydroxy-6-metoxy-1,4-benzoquinol methylase